MKSGRIVFNPFPANMQQFAQFAGHKAGLRAPDAVIEPRSVADFAGFRVAKLANGYITTIG